MPHPPTCPDRDLLGRLLRGEVPDAEAEPLERHLSECESCGRTAAGVTDVDALTDTVRAGARAGAAPLTPPIRQLMARLHDWAPSPAPEGPAGRYPFLAPAAGPGELGRLGPYRVLEVVGSGGMGVVFRAEDPRVKRVVAVKVLLDARCADPRYRTRFHGEAVAVARLRHPNIVQLYEVGEYEGRPYLVLEYVEGSLAQHLAGRPQPSRAAAELVLALARGVQHAHQQGVLHRDLKPANVLLSFSGRSQSGAPAAPLCERPLNEAVPKVTDFGLAKRLDEEGLTQTGDLLGTPGYMAPELTRGHGPGDDTGPAADVYGLGAILYEMLTGRPPFQGESVIDTLEQVRNLDPVPVRRLQPNVPRDLDTICLKCLQKSPRQRYGSAAALADDLQRFLDGVPVRARPVPARERAWKWARRHPAAAALTALSGLAVAAVIAGLWWHTTSLEAQVRRAEAGERKARQQQDRADANYRQARQAINQMLDRLDKLQAPGVPQIETLRRDLSKDALTFFQGMAEAEADADLATRLDFARAYVLMGKLLRGQGQPEAGGENLDHARVLLEMLSAEDPANRDYRIELSNCLDELANCVGDQGRGQECLRFREQALQVREELGRLEPDNANWQRAIAVSHLNVGCCYTDRPEQAESHWKETVRIQEKLVREYPERLVDQHLLAVGLSNLAMLYRDTGRIAEADATYREVEPRLAKLVADHPQRKDWAFDLAQTLRNWGAMLVRARRGEEADQRLNRAVEIEERFLREDPQNPHHQGLLLGCLVARMNNSTLLHRAEEGDKDWRRALALSAQLNSWSDLCSGALMDARLGDHALAAARAEHLAQQKGLQGEDLFQLAKAYGLAAAATEQGQKAERYAAEGVRLLERTREAGFFKDPAALEKMKADPDLGPLRPRDDFQALLARAAGGK